MTVADRHLAAESDALHIHPISLGATHREEPEERRPDPDDDAQGNHGNSNSRMEIKGDSMIGEGVDPNGSTEGREENGKQRHSDSDGHLRTSIH